MRRLLPFIFLLIFSVEAAAESVWLTTGLRSHHEKRDSNYQENNTGFGGEIEYSRSSSFIAGQYRNSFNRESTYLGYRWQPIHSEHWGLGTSNILITGYASYCNDQKQCKPTGTAYLIPVPTITYERSLFGVNVYFIPAVVTAIQLKVRF